MTDNRLLCTSCSNAVTKMCNDCLYADHLREEKATKIVVMILWGQQTLFRPPSFKIPPAKILVVTAKHSSPIKSLRYQQGLALMRMSEAFQV